MATSRPNSGCPGDWVPQIRRLHLSALVHAILWVCFFAVLMNVVPRYEKVFGDFGTEINQYLYVVFEMSYLVVGIGSAGVPIVIVVTTLIDWWILETLTANCSKTCGRVWFWGNVALPILLAVAVGVIIAANLGDLFMQLS